MQEKRKSFDMLTAGDTFRGVSPACVFKMFFLVAMRYFLAAVL